MQCVEACEKVHEGDRRPPLLHMLSDQCALDVSLRDFGLKPEIPTDCFPPMAGATPDSLSSNEGVAKGDSPRDAGTHRHFR